MTTPQGTPTWRSRAAAKAAEPLREQLPRPRRTILPGGRGRGHEALDRWGFGMASVRFICGTQSQHRELEERLSSFLGIDDTILFSSCFDVRTAAPLRGAAHRGGRRHLRDCSAQPTPSIIDGIRLCKAQRLRYANGDMDELAARLEDAAPARRRLIATDGVFSMDGYLAPLPEICELADRHDALVMVDDSHAVGRRRPRTAAALPSATASPNASTSSQAPSAAGQVGGGERWLRQRPRRDRRPAPPARAALPLLEQPRPARSSRRASRRAST